MIWFTRTARRRKRPLSSFTNTRIWKSPSLAVGFVRPHLLWWLRKNFEPYPLGKMALLPKIPGDQDDIPQNSGNRRTTANYKWT